MARIAIALDYDTDEPLDDATHRYLQAVLDAHDNRFGKRRHPSDLRAELTGRLTPGPYQAAHIALREIQTLNDAGHDDLVARALQAVRVDDLGPYTDTDTANRVLAALDAALTLWPSVPTGIAVDRAYARHHPI